MKGINFILRKDLDETDLYINPEHCKKCKGKGCCANCGCAYSPSDFHILSHHYTFEDQLKYFKHLFKKGFISIDHLRIKNQVYGAFDPQTLTIDLNRLLNCQGLLYLRIRNVNSPIVDVIHYKQALLGIKSSCSLWDPDKGCSLPDKKRPKSGRTLIPNFVNGQPECIPLYPEHKIALEWVPYQKLLYKLYTIYISLS